MEDGAMSLFWFLTGFVAGGFLAGLAMSLMNMASYESDRAQMFAIRDMPGAKARADD